MRTYNEEVVRRMTKEQFLEQHPEAGTDYDRICEVKPIPDIPEKKKKVPKTQKRR